MVGSRVAHPTLTGPSLIKEICIAITLGFVAAGAWKKYHLNEKRKTKAFYDMLEKGEISIIAED